MQAIRMLCILMLSILVVVLSAKADDLTVDPKEITINIHAAKDHVSVAVKAPEYSTIQFYMFDVYGKMVKRYEVKGTRTFILDKLLKGTYLYDAFANDAKIKSGKIELK